MNYSNYVQKMKTILQPHAVVLGAVTTDEEQRTQDPERKVIVAGAPKECRGFISVKDNRPHILCNIERFAKTSTNELYRLIHHEYAGLIGVELNQGASSDYEISMQVASSISPRLIYKLVVQMPCLRLGSKERALIGIRCRTTKGAIFERVEKSGFGEAWKLVRGVPSTEGMDRGKIWGDRLSDSYTNKFETHLFATQAPVACRDLGGRLPSKVEFERGEANGIREVLPDMSSRLYWSSTAGQPPYAVWDAFVFSGDEGSVESYARNSDDVSVRCIGNDNK